ncbi:unnamed protein product, partial [Prunus brigantina]
KKTQELRSPTLSSHLHSAPLRCHHHLSTSLQLHGDLSPPTRSTHSNNPCIPSLSAHETHLIPQLFFSDKLAPPNHQQLPPNHLQHIHPPTPNHTTPNRTTPKHQPAHNHLQQIHPYLANPIDPPPQIATPN